MWLLDSLPFGLNREAQPWILSNILVFALGQNVDTPLARQIAAWEEEDRLSVNAGGAARSASELREARAILDREEEAQAGLPGASNLGSHFQWAPGEGVVLSQRRTNAVPSPILRRIPEELPPTLVDQITRERQPR